MTCYGGTSKDCVSCNIEEGFSNDTKGLCATILCGDGTYKYIDLSSREITCLPCDPACAACDRAGADECIECAKGYISYASSMRHRVECRDCPKGFARNANAVCEGSASGEA